MGRASQIPHASGFPRQFMVLVYSVAMYTICRREITVLVSIYIGMVHRPADRPPKSDPSYR
jgi:hypothetical protein